MQTKSTVLFYILGSFFLANALLAEFIGVKIFSLEQTLGIEPYRFNILGVEQLSFNLTAGVLLWPFVFVLTDIINEYYGKKSVRLISFVTAALIIYAYVIIFIAIKLHGADFWLLRFTPNGMLDMDNAFNTILGQGMWIIIGSVVAFLVSQIIDVSVFQYIRKLTGSKNIWLRATGSTLVSQFIDSFVVLFIAFYIGAGWDFNVVIAIGIVNYIYKFLVAIAMTPVLYAVHWLIDKYFENANAIQLKQ
ncbi:MAG: queuosine precursor transporter [Ignavibacteria bacterium]|nr:queuosine precursor transporter [Ignavibacteria bacterium]